MSCEVCAFVDHRKYEIVSFYWQADGVPLVTTKIDCPECGWTQAMNQVWL